MCRHATGREDGIPLCFREAMLLHHGQCVENGRTGTCGAGVSMRKLGRVRGEAGEELS